MRAPAATGDLRHPAFPEGVTRDKLRHWFRTGRARSREVFDIVRPEAYYSRPIELRNPVVFYEGHLPAFTINTVMKLAFREPGIDESYETLFARGIDPDSPDAVKPATDVWPSRSAVQAYGAKADALIAGVLDERELADHSVPQLRDAEAILAIMEHEQMHQETLLYMFNNMPYEQKIARAPFNRSTPLEKRREPLRNELIHIEEGVATVGADRGSAGFGWDNEFPRHEVTVRAFDIQKHSVTNGDYLEYMSATGSSAPNFWTWKEGQWFWRGMFQLTPLPLDWPVYATYDEARAYAKWKGMRVPTEPEYHRAAFGTPSGEERMYPWGSGEADMTRGNFNFTNWDPVPAGSYPAGASAWGVHDLVGNGWEWTSTKFAPYDGFQPMPSYPIYSTDFFDGEHYVLKGASPATARELVRPSFRNWFRRNYPYVYAKFRCAR